MIEIKLKRNESVDRALKRLKKKMDREGILKEVRFRRHYQKPSVKKRQKMKVAKFSQYLRSKEDNLWR